MATCFSLLEKNLLNCILKSVCVYAQSEFLTLRICQHGFHPHETTWPPGALQSSASAVLMIDIFCDMRAPVTAFLFLKNPTELGFL